jgi:hypothetical protein
MRIFAASALLVLTMSAPAFARDRWVIVRDHPRYVVAGPFHDHATCERILHHRYHNHPYHCARP